MNILDTIAEGVGDTPLVRIHHLNDGGAEILAKVEAFNPLSSVKDRLGKALIDDAEKRGTLKPGGTIIEATSGNTGIALAYLAAAKGYSLILTMPESMSVERRNLLKALGAELVLTPAEKGMKGSIEAAHQIAQERGALLMAQFDNPANPSIHETTTGPEIWEATDGAVDIVVSAVGTGGTLTGIARALAPKGVKIVAVEPARSAVLSGGKAGPHKIQGIGAGFIPQVLDVAIIDEVIAVGDDAAGEMARNASLKEGLLVGISSGAALVAAIELSHREENRGKKIVVILPDSGERYLSTWLFQE